MKRAKEFKSMSVDFDDEDMNADSSSSPIKIQRLTLDNTAPISPSFS